MNSLPFVEVTIQFSADNPSCDRRTVYRLAVERKMPGFKVGATWRFKRVDIDGWIAAQSAAPAGGEGMEGKRAR